MSVHPVFQKEFYSDFQTNAFELNIFHAYQAFLEAVIVSLLYYQYYQPESNY